MLALLAEVPPVLVAIAVYLPAGESLLVIVAA